MFRDALVIFRKELRAIFKDRRAVFANYIIPLLLMPAVLLVLDATTNRTISSFEETEFDVVIRNNDDPRLRSAIGGIVWREVEETDEDGIVVTFPVGYRPGDAASVELAWRATSSTVSFAASRVEQALGAYERLLMDERLTELGSSLGELETISVARIDTSPADAQGADFLVTLLPYLIVVYLFAGSMSVALDTTAGEKERGSLAILLVNQVSRTSIALGKVMYVVTSAVINAISSFAGIVIAVTLIGDGAFGGGDAGSLLVPGKLVALVVVFVAMAGVAASAMVLLGSLARTMKEGGAYASPVYILAILIGIGTMTADPTLELGPAFIPIYNGIMAIKGILLSRYTGAQVAVTVLTNLALLGVLMGVVARLYRTERILDTTAR